METERRIVQEGAECELETALVLVLAQFSPALAALSAEYDPDSAAREIPLHITLLYPFVPRRELTDDVASTLSRFFAERPPLSFELARIEEFPDVLYAAPDPAGGVVDLINALARVFPETPPYGGAFAEPIPHVTLVALGEDADRKQIGAELRAAAAPLLPVSCDVSYASLLEEHRPKRWRERERFALASTTGRSG